ncbi:MAG: hypothetical protein EAY75_14640 [Bacteroidetes bacterium]|nr:MAG: hypothetical protein EAY75_14640 [Bacteroidota bacterium]
MKNFIDAEPLYNIYSKRDNYKGVLASRTQMVVSIKTTRFFGLQAIRVLLMECCQRPMCELGLQQQHGD